MPRTARIKGESQIYHIVLRGINQQTIFENAEDCKTYLKIVKEYKAICGYKVYGYCLMGNHVHLLLKAENEDLNQIFKRIGAKFVYWYNNKYRRIGHLFQDRYKSEPIDGDRYFLSVLRYIHQNPVKANITSKMGDYPYSSYLEYVGLIQNNLADVDFGLEMLPKQEFILFMNEKSNDTYLDISERKFTLTDEQAKIEIEKLSGCDSVADFQKIDNTARNEFLVQLKGKGISIRQLSRLTGISKGIIERQR